MDVNDTFLHTMRMAIRQHSMIHDDETVLAAVSGGADSMALLHGLRALGYRIAVAHVDHQTRDGMSGEDAAFVEALCRDLNISCHLISRPVAEEAIEAGLPFEVHARNVRYAFLSDTAADCGYSVIATGHHRDDLAETVVMRVLTGTGIDGLAGIPPIRTVNEIPVIRPLLECSRGGIEAWLREKGIAWREDITNADTAITRNYLRHVLLPEIRERLNPRVTEALCRLADLAREDAALLDGLTQTFMPRVMENENSIKRAGFSGIHPALQRRILRRIFLEKGVEADAAAVLDAVLFVQEAVTGARQTVSGSLTLYAGREEVRLLESDSGLEYIPVKPVVPGETEAFGRRFSMRITDTSPSENLREWCGPQRQVIDADAVAGDLLIRGRQPGDRFQPLGMEGTRKLQDYFVDAGVPEPDRDAWPLVADDEKILWITGHAVSAEAAVHDGTRRFLIIEVLSG